MKDLTVLAGCLLLAVGGPVAADCSGFRLNSTLPTVLGNQTVCATGVGTLAGKTWQELHTATTADGGPLTEYAKGPTDPVDPSQVVGSWLLLYNTAPVRPNRVQYTYGTDPAQVYVWRIYDHTGGNYSFCTDEAVPQEIATATIQAVGPCP